MAALLSEKLPYRRSRGSRRRLRSKGGLGSLSQDKFNTIVVTLRVEQKFFTNFRGPKGRNLIAAPLGRGGLVLIFGGFEDCHFMA